MHRIRYTLLTESVSQWLAANSYAPRTAGLPFNGVVAMDCHGNLHGTPLI